MFIVKNEAYYYVDKHFLYGLGVSKHCSRHPIGGIHFHRRNQNLTPIKHLIKNNH